MALTKYQKDTTSVNVSKGGEGGHNAKCAIYLRSSACQVAEVDNPSSSACGDCARPQTIRWIAQFAGRLSSRIATATHRLGSINTADDENDC